VRVVCARVSPLHAPDRINERSVFAEVVGERMGGLIGWGQWRACAKQSQKGMCVHWDGPDPDTKAIDDDVNMQNE
jgi:hypothetical protein